MVQGESGVACLQLLKELLALLHLVSEQQSQPLEDLQQRSRLSPSLWVCRAWVNMFSTALDIFVNKWLEGVNKSYTHQALVDD
jgi:hypothetical protein